MSLRASFTDLFMDPISYEMMKDPVINACGHTFEREQINGWIADCRAKGRDAECPLDRSPISNLAPNILIRQALEVLNSRQNALVDRVEDLTDEEKSQVEEAQIFVEQRRNADAGAGIPHKIEEPRSFIEVVKSVYASIYSCS